MINMERIFESLEDGGSFSQEMREVLDKIMSLKSPMKFDDSIATEEQLNRLEEELEKLLNVEPIKRNFINAVIFLEPVRTNVSFI